MIGDSDHMGTNVVYFVFSRHKNKIRDVFLNGIREKGNYSVSLGTE